MTFLLFSFILYIFGASCKEGYTNDGYGYCIYNSECISVGDNDICVKLQLSTQLVLTIFVFIIHNMFYLIMVGNVVNVLINTQ